jgi:hypothetical protein
MQLLNKAVLVLDAPAFTVSAQLNKEGNGFPITGYDVNGDAESGKTGAQLFDNFRIDRVSPAEREKMLFFELEGLADQGRSNRGTLST